MENQTEIVCPSCGATVKSTAYFCSDCGKQLKDKPPVKTLLGQTIVYIVSLFLPPFGLYYVWKYFKAGDYESRKIALIALILTLASTIITIWISAGFITAVFQSINEINSIQ